MKHELQTIPGVGRQTVKDLTALGYTTVASLRRADPEEMYQRSCQLAGTPLDPCVLYVYRCAVCFSNDPFPDPSQYRWWYFKDPAYCPYRRCPPKTARLLLRPLTLSDAPAFYQYARHPEVGPRAGWPPHKSLHETEEILRTVFLPAPYTYGIFMRPSEELIGSIGLIDDPHRPQTGIQMLGYSLAYPAWGKGFMTEAVSSLLVFAQQSLHLPMISAYCSPTNAASKRVLQKNGFVYEGRLHNGEKNADGTVCDVDCYYWTPSNRA